MRIQAIIIAITFCTYWSPLSAQEITGRILDENNAVLPAATVIGMSEDSSFVSFTTSDEQGQFILSRQGVDMIQISYIGYETYWSNEPSRNEPSIALGDIILEVTNHQLQSVQIEANLNRLQLNGDTINYSTEHMATQPGDVVEDILDQLPGVEVQSDGSVKAFGEQVQNVLVDGEPFFGKDTRMATKNLAAEAVDQVQVFDKASDYSDFTGVEDGRDEMSINLKLKEDFKNGYFGKVDAGHGDQGRFTGRGNLNRFGKKHRTSFIGLSNNRNEPGFTMEQYFEFMGGMEAFMEDGGRIEIDLNDQVGLPLGDQNEPGLHTKATGGINYTSKWTEKLKTQFHYLYNFNHQDLKEKLTQESLIEGDILRVRDTTNLTNRSHFHNGYLKTTFSPSKRQKLSWSVNASLGFEEEMRNTSQVGMVNNQNFSSLLGRMDEQDGQSTILVSALDHKYRFENSSSIITNARMTYHTKSQETDQDLMTNWADGQQNDQFIRQGYEMENIEGKFSTNYVWPINKQWTSDVSLTGNAKRRSLQRPWLMDSTQQNELTLVESLSGDVTNQTLGLTPRLKLRYARESWNIAATLGRSQQQQLIEVGGEPSTNQRDYAAWLPNVFARWEIGRSQSLNFEYYTDLILPTAEQLQPTPNYIDPVNIYLGNPDLKAMLRHELGLRYFHYSQWYDATTYARINSGHVRDQINHLVSTDSLLRQTFTPVNTSSLQHIGLTAEHSRPLGFWNITAKAKTSLRMEQGELFIQETPNDIVKHQYRVSLGIGHRRVKNWKWGLTQEWRRNSTQFSINSRFNQKYGTQTTRGFIQYIPSEHFDIKVDGKWEVYDNPLNIPQNDLVIVNLSMTKYFGQSKQFRVGLNMYDILNQNTGINRFAEGNAVIDQRFNNLGRHVMVVFGYNMRGFKKADQGVINIRVGNE